MKCRSQLHWHCRFQHFLYSPGETVFSEITNGPKEMLINGSKRLCKKTIPQVKRVSRIFHQLSCQSTCHQRKLTFEIQSPAKPRAHQNNKTPNNLNHDAHLNAPETTLCKQL